MRTGIVQVDYVRGAQKSATREAITCAGGVSKKARLLARVRRRMLNVDGAPTCREADRLGHRDFRGFFFPRMRFATLFSIRNSLPHFWHSRLESRDNFHR